MGTLTAELQDDERLQVEGAELEFVSGPDAGLRIPLPTHAILIGTADTCDVMLTDTTVSQRHVEISLTQRGYILRDLGSKNGVVISGLRIERMLLPTDVKIRMGATVFVVRRLDTQHSLRLGQSRTFMGLGARSVGMRALVAQLESLAPSDVTILIEGETGSGKEVTAQAIHQASPRRNGPFVVFDCGAVTASLVGSELFGHIRGSFTGATSDRPGLLEEADGGTLFIDEIGELPLELQPSLLRVIDSKASRRIGARTERRCDVRIVAATHRNLAEEVKAKRFREDLYFRLAVARVRVPPLRERVEDLPELIERLCAEHGVTLGKDMIAPLLAYEWPGNVRELRNAIARFAASGTALPDAPADSVFLEGSQLRSLPGARRVANEAFEQQYLVRALAISEGSITRAAELAGVSTRFIHRLIAKYR